jgi:excisionase family DNA binding protein
MIQEVMTAEQLAKYLQLDEQTIYRKARSGEIPVVHIGKTLRFKKDVVDDWLRVSSLKWTARKRQNLRVWAEDFARRKGFKEDDIQRAICKRRYRK